MRAKLTIVRRVAFYGCVGLWALLTAILTFAPAQAQFAPEFQINASHAILIDHASGTVLFEKNADEPWPPASLAKLMTMEIVFSEIENGGLRLDEELVVSVNAWRTGGAPAGGSTMFAEVKSRVSVENLIQGAVVVSGNDACIVFAEAIAGNEDRFARMMNSRARELGLDSAHFENSTGLPHPGQAISVRDLAKLASHLIREYPVFYKYYGQPEFTWNKIRQRNRNPLLDMTIGADGLKTGYIKESGYGLVGSAIQEGQRLIVVVHGAETPKDRENDARRLLEWGFDSFESRQIFPAGAPVAEVRVFGGDSRYVPVRGDGAIYLLSPRRGNDKFIARVHYHGPVRAPIADGDEIARLRVMRGDSLALEVPLYAATDVEQGTLAERAFDSVTEIAGGWIRSGINSILSN